MRRSLLILLAVLISSATIVGLSSVVAKRLWAHHFARPGDDLVREAIVLCEWEDLPVAEAAAVLKTTPKAVESRLYRARQLLRQRLKKWL